MRPIPNPTRLFGAVAVAVLLAGCVTRGLAPPAGRADPYPAPLNDPTITVLAPELRDQLVFQPAVVTWDAHGPMEVQVPVRSLADRTYVVDYRIRFYDADDRELAPVMGWRMTALAPRQITRLTGNALDGVAEGYRLEVKWAE